jgi:hypothetical protein
LTVTNFLGESASGAITVKVINDTNIPTVTIRGRNSIQTIAANDISITADAAMTTVALESAEMTYWWTVVHEESVLLLSSESLSPKKFFLPAYSLEALKSYTVMFHVNLHVSGVLRGSASASVVVYVASGPIMAVIAGTDNVLWLVLI